VNDGIDLETPSDADRPGELSAELREALDGLRGEIRTRFPVRERIPVEKIDWMALIQQIQRRVSTFGMSERSGEVDEFGMDEIVVRRARPLLDLLYEHYWRVELHGIDQIPDAGPCLFVANRSGLLPYDGLMVSHAIWRMRPTLQPRFMVADWLITLPFVQPYLARLGGVRACRESGFSRGTEGRREGLSRTLSAQALRTGRCGSRGSRDAGTNHSDWHRRRGGGSSDFVQMGHSGAGGGAAIPSGHPDVSAARPARPPTAADQVGDPDRRADLDQPPGARRRAG